MSSAPPLQLGERGSLEGVGPETHVHKTHNIQDKEYRTQDIEQGNRTQELLYKNYQLTCFFYMALGLDDFDAGKSITRAIGRGGP